MRTLPILLALCVAQVGCSSPTPRFTNVTPEGAAPAKLDRAPEDVCPPPPDDGQACDAEPAIQNEKACLARFNAGALETALADRRLEVLEVPTVSEGQLVTPQNRDRLLQFRGVVTMPSGVSPGTTMGIAEADRARFGAGTLILLERGGASRCTHVDALGIPHRLRVARSTAARGPERIRLVSVDAQPIQSRQRRSCACPSQPRCEPAPRESLFLRVPATMSVDSRTRVPVAVAQLFTDHPNVATMDCLCHDRPDWQCSRLNKWKTVAPAPSPSTPVPSNP